MARDEQISTLAGAIIVLDDLGMTELADALQTWLDDLIEQRDAARALEAGVETSVAA